MQHARTMTYPESTYLALEDLPLAVDSVDLDQTENDHGMISAKQCPVALMRNGDRQKLFKHRVRWDVCRFEIFIGLAQRLTALNQCFEGAIKPNASRHCV